MLLGGVRRALAVILYAARVGQAVRARVAGETPHSRMWPLPHVASVSPDSVRGERF